MMALMFSTAFVTPLPRYLHAIMNYIIWVVYAMRYNVSAGTIGCLQASWYHALGLVTVAQLHGLVHASGGTAGHRGAEHALASVHIGLNSGVATRVDDLTADDLGNLRRRQLGQGLGLQCILGAAKVHN